MMSTTTTPPSPPQQVITELGPDDVLFGRGAPIVQTTGNVRFRDVVNAHKAAYASTRCRQTKDTIARDIIQAIDERGGKFLKEIKSSDDVRKYDVPTGTKAWIVADYDEIVEKVKQTLRETDKSMMDKEHFQADSNRYVTTTSSLTNISGNRTTRNDPQEPHRLVQMDDHRPQFRGVPVAGPDATPAAISSTLLPLVQQQLVTLQNNHRRYQMQQEIARSLQEYQNQILVDASIEAAAALGRGASAASSSVPGSIEDYFLQLSALQGGGASSDAFVGTGTNHSQLVLALSSLSSSSIPNNPYLTSVPSATTLSLLSHINNNGSTNHVNTNYNNNNNSTSQSTIDEILQRDAVLTALRRHRQQLEDGLPEPTLHFMNSSTTTATTTTLPNDNDIPPSLANITSMSSAGSGGDAIRDTTTINNISRLEDIASSLLSQHRDDPTHLLSQTNPPTIPTILLRGSSLQNPDPILKPVAWSDSMVRSANGRNNNHTITTATSATDTEDESIIPASKKKRRDK